MTNGQGPAVVVINDEMERIAGADAAFEEVACGLEFTEGPVWLAGAGELVFSDIPASTLYAWSARDGLRVFRRPSHRANGNTTDGAGRLITCEHESRRVTRTEADGSVTVLCESHGGRRLNSPNDAVVDREGAIWFTDPPYGIKAEEVEQDGHYVFRLDAGSDEPVVVARDFLMPNGLCFGPEEAVLYVADSSRERHHIRRLVVTEQRGLEDDGVFAVIEPHVPDGMRVDGEGRLLTTAGDGVQVFRPDGEMIGKFLTPEVAANCCFGGADGRSLFITATSSVWRVSLR
jgi:gluconolactonase